MSLGMLLHKQQGKYVQLRSIFFLYLYKNRLDPKVEGYEVKCVLTEAMGVLATVECV